MILAENWLLANYSMVVRSEKEIGRRSFYLKQCNEVKLFMEY